MPRLETVGAFLCETDDAILFSAGPLGGILDLHITKQSFQTRRGEHVKVDINLPMLPPATMLETVAVLKALNRASRALADLKGDAKTIPNQGSLIDTLALQKATASSEVEGIVTTQDERF